MPSTFNRNSAPSAQGAPHRIVFGVKYRHNAYCSSRYSAPYASVDNAGAVASPTSKRASTRSQCNAAQAASAQGDGFFCDSNARYTGRTDPSVRSHSTVRYGALRSDTRNRKRWESSR